jgi:Ca-activated chloride channel family protein
LKRFFTYLLFFAAVKTAQGQFYLRGQITDDKKNPVSNARILVYSLKSYFYSGAGNGTFGISLKVATDSLFINAEGFEPLTILVKSNEWQNIMLKPLENSTFKTVSKLASLANRWEHAEVNPVYENDETYFKLVENKFTSTAQFPHSGYSLNVNKASYSNVRRFINQNSLVPPDAVRVEEMVNYFNLQYHPPVNNTDFNIQTLQTTCPWKKEDELLYINISAKEIVLEKIPPGNFVFLIDVSGSMDMPNRLPLIKEAFQLFVKNLRPQDKVSIVTYGGFVEVWLPATSGVEKAKILESIESLRAEGDTPGESAIRLAYRVARNNFLPDGNNRIILATDGDFNVGENSEKGLDELISKQSQTGIYLTCLGVGMGNLKDSKLQVLAKKGNGNYAYLDNSSEAERVLVKELTRTLYAVADDASVNIDFNLELIDQYRLIGFDNKREALNIANNQLEGGEIGSGSSVLAVYQIKRKLTNKNIDQAKEDIVCKLQLKYRKVRDSSMQSQNINILNDCIAFDSASNEIRLAAAISMFGMKIRQSTYKDSIPWKKIQEVAAKSVNNQNYLHRELLILMEKAKKLYPDKKIKSKKKWIFF